MYNNSRFSFLNAQKPEGAVDLNGDGKPETAYSMNYKAGNLAML